MLTRRTLFLFSIVSIAACAALGGARAADKAPFSPAAFQAAKKAGRPILIDVTAPWCPTCRAQKPILSELLADPRFRAMAVFEVDFDSQKDVLRAIDVRMQSTLVAFKGDREVGRTTGDTDRASIGRLLDKAI